jgi:hypothetical protein
MSKSKRMPLSQPLWEFFRVEIRNEDAGGVSPATLWSALESFRQADNETLGNWFWIVEFTDGLRKVYQEEITTLNFVFGKDEKLERFLGRCKMNREMSKYRVHVCRTAYSHLDIVVDAYNERDAAKIAESNAGDHVFPTENSSEYSVEGCTKIS